MKFQISPTLFNSSKWLQFVLSAIKKVFDDPDVIISRLLLPVIREVYHVAETMLPDDENILIQKAKEMINSLGIEIYIGLCSHESFV